MVSVHSHISYYLEVRRSESEEIETNTSALQRNDDNDSITMSKASVLHRVSTVHVSGPAACYKQATYGTYIHGLSSNLTALVFS